MGCDHNMKSGRYECFYVIQTNFLKNEFGMTLDYQNRVFRIDNISWDKFKEHILDDTQKGYKVPSTMFGATKYNGEIRDVYENNDMQLSLEYYKPDGFIHTMFYKVSESNFSRIYSKI